MKIKASTALVGSLGCPASHPEAKPCSRCKATGMTNHVTMHLGVHGKCYKCDGSGYTGGLLVELSKLAKPLASTLAEGHQRRDRYHVTVQRLVMTKLGLHPSWESAEFVATWVTRDYSMLLAGRRNYKVIRDRVDAINAELATQNRSPAL